MIYRLGDGTSFFLSLGLGLAISMGHPAGIVAAVAMPIPCLMPKSRRRAFANALAYYTAGLWPVIPGVSRFTGHSVLLPILLWACASTLLSLPWILAWTPSNQLQYLWRVPLAEIAAIIPPLGLVGFISPLTGAGYLFPGTGWAGLIATMTVASIVLALGSSTGNRHILGVALSGVVALGLGSQFDHGDVKAPTNWEAVNTHFGDVSRPFEDFVAARSIEERIAASSSRVIIFPESVVPLWSDATSDFWRQTLADCRTRGQIVAIGAGLPRVLSDPKKEAAEADLIESYDFSAALQALRSDDDGRHSEPEPGRTTNTLAPFDNALLILGAESTVYYQRVPVPLGMWQPIGNRGVPLRMNSPGVITIDGQRVAILICYEQILTYPILAAMLEHPTVVVGSSNLYWFSDTTIPRYQASALRAWAKLFRLPYLLAVNS